MKDGLQDHALFRMDGRVWIEPIFPPRDKFSKRMREIKIQKGYMILIPQDKLMEFVEKI